MTGRMTGQRNGRPPVAFLPQLCHETEKETGREREKVTKRRPRGEQRKRRSLFVVLKTRLMRMGGPQCGVNSQDDGFKLLSYLGLTTFEDYYTCASTSLNWIL